MPLPPACHCGRLQGTPLIWTAFSMSSRVKRRMWRCNIMQSSNCHLVLSTWGARIQLAMMEWVQATMQMQVKMQCGIFFVVGGCRGKG